MLVVYFENACNVANISFKIPYIGTTAGVEIPVYYKGDRLASYSYQTWDAFSLKQFVFMQDGSNNPIWRMIEEDKYDVDIAGDLTVSGDASFTQIPTAPTATAGDNSTQLATTAFVANAVSSLSGPMRFMGTVGTGGTVTSSTIAEAAAANKGYTYKVITDGTYQGVAAKVGDLLVSDGSNWILIPAGDEPGGTVTSVTLKAGSGITLDTDNTAITTSGTRTISHADTSSVSNVTAANRTYVKSLTFDTYGHVTAVSTGTETVTDTDRYVNSATFADDTTATAASPVKMTLTRAGSDTQTVTANIPKVSSSSAGVAPKGTTVSSQSQSTKFLREDGTWAVPSYTTNTNTATAKDDILDGSNSGTEITYKPYTTQQSQLSFDTSSTNPTLTTRLNLNGYLYATKLYSNGTEVLTSHQSVVNNNINLTWGTETTIATIGGTPIKVKIPSNPDTNTDTKVKQSSSTTEHWRKLLLHYKDDTSSTTAVTDSTDQVYAAVDISAQPSTGSIRANTYKVSDNATVTYNSTNGCLEIIV